MLDKLNEGVWEIKLKDDDPSKRSRLYHLIHYRVRNIRQPQVHFPLRSRWEGAKLNNDLISHNDITCYTFSSKSNLGETTVRGHISFGRNGPICRFSESRGKIAELFAGLWAIRAGITLIQKYATTKAPKALKIWIVSDNEEALKQVWGLQSAGQT